MRNTPILADQYGFVLMTYDVFYLTCAFRCRQIPLFCKLRSLSQYG